MVDMKKIKLIMDLLYKVYNVNVTYYSRTYDMIGHAIDTELIPLLHRVVHVARESEEPFILTYHKKGTLLTVPHYNEDKYMGQVIVDPIATNEEELGLISDYSSANRVNTIARILMDLFHMDQPINAQQMPKILHDLENEEMMIIDLDYIEEHTLRRLLLSGDVKGVEEFLQGPLSIPNQIIGTSYKRAAKNYFIITATLVSRWSIEAGMHQKASFELSNCYIHTMEELYDPNDIKELLIQMILDYAKHIRTDQRKRYSPSIYKALRYMQKTCNYNLKVQDVANHVQLSVNYFSSKFKEEVGKTYSQYMKDFIINEGKVLLQHSSYSIGEISSQLGFHNQSHFSSCFKAVTNKTPNAFRSGKD